MSNKNEKLKRGYEWLFMYQGPEVEKEVQGKKVQLDAMPDRDFFITGKNGNWILCEYETGFPLIIRNTQKQVKQEGNILLKNKRSKVNKKLKEVRTLNKHNL